MQQILKRLATAIAATGLVIGIIVGTAHPSAADELVTGSRVPLAPDPIKGAGANLPDEYYARGNREIPNLLKAAGVSCTVTQATHIGISNFLDTNGKITGSAELYEAACDEGLGYFVEYIKDKPPIAFDCITAAQSGKLACILPKNRHAAGGLAPYLKSAGVNCAAIRARKISEDATLKQREYEVDCNGDGYILDIPLQDGTGPAAKAFNCLQLPGACIFTSHIDSVAALAHAVGQALGADCRIGDARYVGFVEATQRDLYELSCQPEHDGLLVAVDLGGVVRGSMPCASTNLKGESCLLKPTDSGNPLILQAEMEGAAPHPAVTKANWLKTPDGNDFLDAYPSKAFAIGLTGQATLVCRFDSSGFLKNCFAIDESPAGYGFGDAALKLASKFRLTPPTGNGVPIAGRMTIPIRFTLGR